MAAGTSNVIQCSQIAFDNTTTGGKFATLNGVQKITVRTSADVYIDFDQPASTSQSFKLLSANTSDTTIEVSGGAINKLYALGASGSGTLYIIAVTN